MSMSPGDEVKRMMIDRESLEILYRVDERTKSIQASMDNLHGQLREEKDYSRQWKTAMELRVSAIEAKVTSADTAGRERQEYSKGAMAVVALVAGGIVQIGGWLVGWWTKR